MIKDKIRFIDIATRPTENAGALSFFEGEKDIPFPIKRFYYIYSAPKGSIRGGHAHKELEQFMFCMNGKVKVILDDGSDKMDVVLDTPSKGIYVKPGLWRDIEYLEENSILAVAASEYYDEADYIRDYDKFKLYVRMDD